MPQIKCFDVVEMVLAEATQRFAPLFAESADSKEELKRYCDVLDEIAQEFDAQSFDVEVDEISMNIAITMESPDIIIRSGEHRFFDLVNMAISVKFSHGEGDTVAVRFMLPGIWTRSA